MIILMQYGHTLISYFSFFNSTQKHKINDFSGVIFFFLCLSLNKPERALH